MDIPENRFKRAIAAGRQQIGLWCALPSAQTAEALATCGFDWMVLDTEHAPGDPLTVYEQLRAVAPYPVAPLVRPAANDAVLIKRILDAGAQTLIVPQVQNRREAAAAVAAVRYPPRGIRGVAGNTRANRFGLVEDYYARAEAEICLILQAETREALDELEAIASLEGVDGVFIGPADLAASLGHLGNQGHPDVRKAVLDAIRRVRKAGKPAGILTLDREFAHECMTAGSVFTAVDVDVAVLTRGARRIAADFRKG
jgi:4-hydroxy-2-oxoheptanedioate aldolase